jgi:hypothetical protein
MRGWKFVTVLAVVVGCGGSMGRTDGGGGRDGGGGGRDSGGRRDAGPPVPSGEWPTPNEHSWNGSWSPADGDFPIAGLLDDEYFDGHDASPILPPGEWDWDDGRDDLANWRNFENNLGRFQQLKDARDRHFGWALAPNEPEACDYQGPGFYFEGSSGPDQMDLGPRGEIHSSGDGNLADGPDVLVFNSSFSLDYRTGSSERGSARDDDLVIGGCDENADGEFDILTSTFHTGPGADWVFVRDISRSAVDLGNGAGGRTDTLDDGDGNDLVVIRGNAHDFRVYGGAGNDVAVWFVDEVVQTTTFLGPNFFGGGGAGDALWDEGTDRLVLAVPTATPIVPRGSTPDGALMVRASDGDVRLDDPTQGDPFARYCIECGTGPGGRKTLILEYRSLDGGAVFTGHFYVTAFEEVQVGLGDGARVYRIDDVAGTLTEMPGADPFLPPTPPADYCQ